MLRARLVSRIRRARREGPRRTSAGLVRKLGSLLLGMALFPLSVVGHFLGYRRITFITQRIGHLAAEPDSFLKAQALGELPRRRWFFLAPPGEVANEHLLSYWTPWIRAVRDPFACYLLRAMSIFGLMRYDAGRYVLWLNHSQEVYRLNTAWSSRAPLLSLNKDDVAWSDPMFRAIGLPEGAWFACIHVREGGFSPYDEDAHSHRNGSIEALLPAVQEIIRRGGWCVRMGDPTASTFPPVAGVIDYAHHALRQARLDVCLCARARFFLGNTSGIALVSTVFGVPSAMANMVPASCLGMLPSDLNIFKLHRRKRDGRILHFREIFNSPTANFRYAYQYELEGLEVLENTGDEIRELACEMLDRLDGRFAPDDCDDDVQARFRSLLKPGDYGYYASSRVGAAFLKRHAGLLMQGPGSGH